MRSFESSTKNNQADQPEVVPAPEIPPESDTPSPVEGFALVFVCGVFFFGGALLLSAADVFDARLVVTLQFAALLLPALLWAGYRGVSGRAFPAGKASGGTIAEAALWAVMGSLAAFLMAFVMTRWVGTEPETEMLEKLIREYPFSLQLLLFALVPAICEELLFRGAFLACLSRWHAPLACLASAVMFGMFHGSLVRFFPSAALGFFLAVLVLRTRNIWLAVAAHGLHNGFVLWAMNAWGGEGL